MKWIELETILKYLYTSVFWKWNKFIKGLNEVNSFEVNWIKLEIVFHRLFRSSKFIFLQFGFIVIVIIIIINIIIIRIIFIIVIITIITITKPLVLLSLGSGVDAANTIVEEKCSVLFSFMKCSPVCYSLEKLSEVKYIEVHWNWKHT